MVQMFSPDESAVYPYIMRMIAPANSLEQALRSFVFYDYYYYGFPYFGLSALVLIPLRWFGQLDNMPLVMLLLRQMISVLPMLAGLLLLVYLQDGYRTYRSPVLLSFLLVVPAVLSNNNWWHPDGIVFFLVVLTIFFLWRDNLRLGWNFLFAAVTCGIATATKIMGLYFFLAVGLVLVVALFARKASWKRCVGMAIAFLGVLAISFVAANPFLLSHWARTAYWYIFQKQTDLLNFGYGVIYAKGLAASWPDVRGGFGGAIFLLLSLGVAIWAVIRGPKRLLYGIILAWFIPVSVSVFWFTHFKYQYWLPAAIPLLSSLVLLLPEKWSRPVSFQVQNLFRYAAILIVVVQIAFFIRSDAAFFSERIHRAENNPRIQFYNQSMDVLQPLVGMKLNTYYDYRLYLPETPGWSQVTTFDLLEYNFIQQNQFGILLLLEQRIRDYLQPGMTGIDPELFKRNQQFYRDADNATVTGYHLLYRDPVGLIYVSDQLYQEYFRK